MVVSIADLESKFMGETAKNIAALFRQATEEEAVLFFDEADTLLGKRLSSVTQGIDNEVNAMRSTLLIELEKHTGIVIFATNFVKTTTAHSSAVSLTMLVLRYPAARSVFASGKNCSCALFRLPMHGKRCWKAPCLSEGLSGRDIRNAMRLALPKAVLESEQKLTLKHLESALAQIRDAYDAISNAASFVPPHINTAKKMLGLS
jgi:SpoVK/Ycf46/Vps4 family AAA+-type ATPase